MANTNKMQMENFLIESPPHKQNPIPSSEMGSNFISTHTPPNELKVINERPKSWLHPIKGEWKSQQHSEIR